MIKNIVRALRLPFISASILPFIFGTLIERSKFNIFASSLGLVVVVFTHLSANLINDYADSRSKADWQDKRFFGFFGGSKLIQEGAFSETFYFYTAIVCAIIALISVVLLALLLKSFLVLFIYLLVIVFSWQYTAKPLQLSYHYCGEPFLFLFFGPILVMGGYFIQTGIFPDLKSLLLSLPFGFFTTAILFANEVPDLSTDKNVHKYNWVSLIGAQRAYILYCLLAVSGFLSILLNILIGYLGFYAYFVFIFVFLAVKAARILKNNCLEKEKLVRSSALTINMQLYVSIILILSLIL